MTWLPGPHLLPSLCPGKTTRQPCASFQAVSLLPASNTPADESPASFPAQPGTAAQRADLGAGLPSPGPQCPYRRTGFVPHSLLLFLDLFLTPPPVAPGPPSARLPAKCRSINAGCENEWRWATGQYGAPLRGQAGLALRACCRPPPGRLELRGRQGGVGPAACGRPPGPLTPPDPSQPSALRAVIYCETGADPGPCVLASPRGQGGRGITQLKGYREPQRLTPHFP